MNELQWIEDCNPIDGEQLREEYIEYFKDNVMTNSDTNHGPYDGYGEIPNWREAISLRNDVLDKTSYMHKQLVENGYYEMSVKQLRVITYEEYVKEFYPHYEINKI